jgi:hypothetical protein
MFTQKERIRYELFHYIAQRSDYLARLTGIPAPSVRRVLAELVAAGRAKFVTKDQFGFAGYLATGRSHRGRHA